MNQIMAVGRGIVIALERPLSHGQHQAFMEQWRERMGPDIPAFLIGEARIVVNDRQIVFEFTGTALTPTFVGEFQKWWEGVNYG